MHPRLAFIIWKKDLADAFRNGRILASIAFPILFSLLFGRMFNTSSAGTSGGTSVGTPPKYAVYDAAGSRLSTALDALDGMVVRHADSDQQLRQWVGSGDVDAGLVVPADLDAALAEGRTSDIEVVVRDDRSKAATLGAATIERMRALAGQSEPLNVQIQVVPRPTPVKGTSTSDSLAMWLVMGLAMVGSYVVPMVIAEEKEKRTLSAVLVAPASYLDVIVAKAGLGLVYALTASVLVLALNNGLVGNVPVLLAALVIGSFVVVEIGLLLGSSLPDVTSVTTWSSMVSLVLLIPGMFRTFLTSGLVKGGVLLTISRLIPTHYVLDMASMAMSNQTTLSAIGLDLAVLIACVFVFLGANVYALRRREA
jgi:ABC-2 type transport system permease protein